jgi:hypothetical protein
MSKSKEKERLDVAFPVDIYKKIEQIAIETNQPINHISRKVTLTPVVLNLVRLGLEKFEEEGFVKLEKKKTPETVDEIALKVDFLEEIIFNYFKEIKYEKYLAKVGDQNGCQKESGIEAKTYQPTIQEKPDVETNDRDASQEKPAAIALPEEQPPINPFALTTSKANATEDIREIEIEGKSYRITGVGISQAKLAERLDKADSAAISKKWKAGNIADFMKWSKDKALDKDNSDRKGWLKHEGLFYEVLG